MAPDTNQRKPGWIEVGRRFYRSAAVSRSSPVRRFRSGFNCSAAGLTARDRSVPVFLARYRGFRIRVFRIQGFGPIDQPIVKTRDRIKQIFIGIGLKYPLMNQMFQEIFRLHSRR